MYTNFSEILVLNCSRNCNGSAGEKASIKKPSKNNG